jgi:hypothetical protein
VVSRPRRRGCWSAYGAIRTATAYGIRVPGRRERSRGTHNAMQYARPPFRPLRAYAFNLASDLDLDQAIGNEVSLMVPWEDQQPGPVGEYIEVVDFDRESECFYLPVDGTGPWAPTWASR